MRFVFVALVALTLGGASSASIPPPPPLGGPVVPGELRVLALGDFGIGLPAERTTGEALSRFERRNPASLLLALGDNDYTAGASFSESWNESFGWLRRAGVGVAGVLGNHDVMFEGGSYELAALDMPRRYYTRRFGDVQLFALDSNETGDAQTRWLRRALASSRASWKIAAFHHPAYTCGGYTGRKDIVRRWTPLFARYHVQLVLSGHDHNYQRFLPRRRVTYVVDGGGGAHLYAIVACPYPYPRRLRAISAHGFLYLIVASDRLDGYAISMGGRVIDHFIVGP